MSNQKWEAEIDDRRLLGVSMNMLESIKVIFAGASVTRNILESLQLIKSELRELKESELNTGFSMLNDVPKAIDQKTLLMDARKHFYKAIELEHTERLAYAYLRLAFCLYYLEEKELYRCKLEELSTLIFMNQWQANTIAFLAGLTEPLPPMVRKHRELENALELQENIKKYLEELNDLPDCQNLP